MSVVSLPAILRSSITVTVGLHFLDVGRDARGGDGDRRIPRAAGFLSRFRLRAWAGNAAANANMLAPSALNRPMLRNLPLC